jgi:hypothetical protein
MNSFAGESPDVLKPILESKQEIFFTAKRRSRKLKIEGEFPC